MMMPLQSSVTYPRATYGSDAGRGQLRHDPLLQLWRCYTKCALTIGRGRKENIRLGLGRHGHRV